MKLLLIDAYAMIYRAYYAFLSNPRINSKGMNTSAVFGFVTLMEDVIRRIDPTHVGVAFDPAGKTFRHDAYPAYKAQRQATPEDIRNAVPYIRRIISAHNIPILEQAGFEADDVVGTLARQAEAQGLDVFMATPDKDYGQLVTDHVCMYRPRHAGGFDQMGPREVCEKYGISSPAQVIDLLALMGDASDNVPGCPGVGEKTAVKLIGEFGSIDNLLQHTDQLKGALQRKVVEHTEDIRFSQFLVTIRQDVPITLDLDALQRREPDKAALREVYTELEFRSLLNKLDGTAAAPTAAQATTPQPAEQAEPDLFSAFSQGGDTDVSAALTPAAAMSVSVRQVETLADMEQLIAEAAGQPAFSLALNTTGVHWSASRPESLAFCWEDGRAWSVTLPDDRQSASDLIQALRPLLEGPQLKVVHNLKRLRRVLAQYGVNVDNTHAFDTMLAHYLLQPELHHGLDYMADTCLHLSLGDSAAEAAVVLHELYPLLRAGIERNHLLPLFEDIEMPLSVVLADMERCGVRIDAADLAASSAQLTQEMMQIEQEIIRLAGEPFNVSSPKQVGTILFEHLQLDPKAKKTKSGQYVTSEEVLESLRGRHPIVGKILEHRTLKKLLGTYIDALPQLVNPDTGKLHTTFNQAVTATGRLSSSNPNLQNIPVRTERGKEIRRAFIPDEGCVFMSADYSQVELRIMAHLSGDQHMIDDFQAGHDVHAATAARIYHVGLDQVTSDMRRKAKTANFGIIYGISAFGLAQRLDTSRAEAKQLIDDYFATYPRIAQYIEECKQKARERGYVETLLHRKRFLPDINSRNATVRGFAERNAVNAPIQGTAADIIKIAMVRIARRMKQEGVRAQMNLQVHDELCFSVPVDEVEKMRTIVTEEMQGAAALSVPLIADCGTGANWLEAH